MDVSFNEQPTHLVAACSGEWEARAVTRLIERIRARAETSALTRILVDWREVSRPASDFLRFQAGEDIARALQPPFRIAIIGKQELINKFAESTATNRGALLLVTHDEDAALQWILEGA